MELISFDSLDLFVNLRIDIDSSGIEGEFMLTDEFEIFSQFCGPCVGYSENQNVTDPQKELLPWQRKLGISI